MIEEWPSELLAEIVTKSPKGMSFSLGSQAKQDTGIAKAASIYVEYKDKIIQLNVLRGQLDQAKSLASIAEELIEAAKSKVDYSGD